MVKILFRDVGALTVVDTLTITLFSAPKLAGKVLLILPFNSGHFFFFLSVCAFGCSSILWSPLNPHPTYNDYLTNCINEFSLPIGLFINKHQHFLKI